MEEAAAERATPADVASLPRIGFVGVGAMGGALALALAARGVRVVAVAARHHERAQALAARIPGCVAVESPAAVAARSDLVVVATPDDAIAQVAALPIWSAGQGAVHLSGAMGAEQLAAAAEQGVRIGALHPLLTFPTALRDATPDDILTRMAGATWAVEAPDPALDTTLRRVVAALAGRAITLSAADRAPYHLAAVLSSNYVVALLGAAVALWESFGVAPNDALQALLPLLRGAVDNLGAVGLPNALTGPLARGDRSTIATHLAWLRAHTQPAPTSAPTTSLTAATAMPSSLPPTNEDSPTAPNPPSSGAELTTQQAILAELNAAYIALARLTIPLALAKGTLTDEMAAQIRALLAGQPGDAPPE
ncbi:MAG TPA: DUF2520 domain-containing protein [Ktedonobacterales bacterium]|nr:DUF2520 domain-containing protein [Ktedonobacterales bacterium]